MKESVRIVYRSLETCTLAAIFVRIQKALEQKRRKAKKAPSDQAQLVGYIAKSLDMFYLSFRQGPAQPFFFVKRYFVIRLHRLKRLKEIV